MAYERPRLGERIGLAQSLELRIASSFVKIIERFGSLAPPIGSPPGSDRIGLASEAALHGLPTLVQ
jgi:hypothetical protein